MRNEDGATDTQTVVIGVVADPGVSTELARRLVERLPERLSSHVGAGVTWRVELASHMLYLDDSNQPTILDDGKTLEDRGWDQMVALTELPLRRDGRPLVFEVNTSERTSWISIPALGAFRLSTLLLRTIAAVIYCVSQRKELVLQTSDTARKGRVSILARDQLRGVPGRDEQAESGSIRVGGSRFRLLTGMVRINRPWRLLGSLDRVFAAAAATGAFGVFYASVWNMADTLSILRLAMINVGAIAALVGWLILHNGLWERSPRRGGKTRQPRLYNATTVVSLFVGVSCLYALLFVVAFLGALTIISSEYLESVLNHPVSFVEYLKIAWMASSLGTIAGALGSNFESEADVKRVAYGRRQLERF